MILNVEKFEQAKTKFDILNSKDPNLEELNGQLQPKELIYAQRMSDKLLSFAPESSEALQLAARCQHLCRWEIPRNSYPKGRVGYNRWRNELKKFHADKAGEILSQIDYDKDMIERVQFLVLKKQLKKDVETQTLEDVICLVFLEYYFEKFAAGHTEEKVIDILRKTWRKMSEKGQQAALELSVSDVSKRLIERALA